MIKTFFWSALVLALSASTLEQGILCEGFLPKNDMYIPVGDKASEPTGITEQQFNLVMDKIQSTYAPIMKAKGGNLQINRLWDDGTVNASAERQGNTWILNMYGGLARHPLMTADGMLLVACHETGHHLGGKPKFSSIFGSNSWASVEGEADYFGTVKCMKRILSALTPQELAIFDDNDAVADKACNDAYTEKTDQTLCARNSLAGKVLGNVLADLGQSGEVHFETPSTEAYNGIMEEHPEAQCRLDTYFQGALCTQPFATDLSDNDTFTGSCAKENGFKLGLRPKCWFNPSKRQARRTEITKGLSGDRLQEIFY